MDVNEDDDDDDIGTDDDGIEAIVAAAAVGRAFMVGCFLLPVTVLDRTGPGPGPAIAPALADFTMIDDSIYRFGFGSGFRSALNLCCFFGN
jgi:hypothetical protein